MDRVIRFIYAIIIMLFLVTIGAMGWYIIDEKKNTDNEIAVLRNLLSDNQGNFLQQSNKKIDNPDDIRIIREYSYVTSSEGYMKVVAFDMDSNVVWTYKTNNTDMVEYVYNIFWPAGEIVYVMQTNEVCLLNAYTGDIIKNVTFSGGEEESINAVGCHYDDFYVFTDHWINGGTDLEQVVYKIDKDGNITNKKNIETLYDGFDQSIQNVFADFDGENMKVTVARIGTDSIEKIVNLGF